MRKTYKYEKDKDFLKKIDELRIKDILVKITVLTWNDERPIQEIQGKVISGELNVSNSNPIRRTGSLTVYVDDENKDVVNIDNIISINKKIYVELGIRNVTDQYLEYDYIWFKLGLFILTDLSINNTLEEGIQFSVNMADKMCLLDGSVAGKFTSAVDLDTKLEYIPSTGEDKEIKVLIGDLIIELVHHLGGEPLNNIVISDVDPIITTAMLFGNSTLEDKRYTDALQVLDDAYRVINEEHETDTKTFLLNDLDKYTQWIDYLEPYLINSHTQKEMQNIFDVFLTTQGIFGTDWNSLISGLLEYINLLDGNPTAIVKNAIQEIQDKKGRYTLEDLTDIVYNFYKKTSIRDDIILNYLNVPSKDSSLYNTYCMYWKFFVILYYHNINGKLICKNKYTTEIEQYLKYLYVTKDSSDDYIFIDDKPSTGVEVDSIEEVLSSTSYCTLNQGDFVGYRVEDYVYPQELTGSPGSSIADTLSTIVKTMGGNYEFFYDIDGKFHYQEIKNYLNTTYTTNLLKQSQTDSYLTGNTLNRTIYDNINYDLSKSVYNFDNSNLIQSYSNNLQYSLIKNDFVLWGESQTSTSSKIPIWYHLAIDKKPTISDDDKYNVIVTYPNINSSTYNVLNNYQATFNIDSAEYFSDLPILVHPYSFAEWEEETEKYYYIFYESYIEDGETKVKAYAQSKEQKCPKVAEPDVTKFYVHENTKPITLYEEHSGSQTLPKIYIYFSDVTTINFTGNLDGIEVENQEIVITPHWVEYNEYWKQSLQTYQGHPAIYATIKPIDWRNYLYMDGVDKSPIYSVPNYYYPELSSFFPLIYNVSEQALDSCGRPQCFTDYYMKDIEDSIQCQIATLDWNNSATSKKQLGEYKLVSSYTPLTLAFDKINKEVELFHNDLDKEMLCYVSLDENNEAIVDYDRTDSFIYKMAQYETYNSLAQYGKSYRAFQKVFNFEYITDSSSTSYVNLTRNSDLTTEEQLFARYTEGFQELFTNNNLLIKQIYYHIQQINQYVNFNISANEYGEYWYRDLGLLVNQWIEYYNLILEYGEEDSQGYLTITANNNVYTWITKSFIVLQYLIRAICVEDTRYPYYYDKTLYPIDGDAYIKTEYKDDEKKPEEATRVYVHSVEERLPQGFLPNPSNYKYYLDFIDDSSTIGKYSVQNIGRRTDAVNNTTLNCMIDPDVLNLYLIENPDTIDMTFHEGYTKEAVLQGIKERIENCKFENRPYAFVPTYILFGLTQDTYQGLFEATREMLYTETSLGEKITLSTLPIYHLDVNTRITVKNSDSGIFGDYIIDSLTIPLTVEDMMSISCTKIVDRV